MIANSATPIGKPRPLKTLPLPLRVYAAVLLGTWGVSALPLVIHSPHLWSASPFWYPPPFWDFGCYFQHFQHLHTPQFWTAPGPKWDYPAPCAFVYRLFYAFNRPSTGVHQVFYGFLAYLVFAGCALLTVGLLLARALHRRGLPWTTAAPYIAVCLLLCWPLYFGLERGNIEFFLDTGIALGLWAYIQKRWWLAAVVLGVFGAGKLYPLLFLSLLLPLRRWRPFALGLCTAAATSLFASHWLGAPPASVAHSSGVSQWIRGNSLRFEPLSIGYDHSIFGTIKLLSQSHIDRLPMLAVAYASVGSVAMLVLFFTRIVRLPRPNQLLLVTLAALLLPPTSYDYTLSLLLAAWAWILLLALQHRDDAASRRTTVFLALLALLFAPEAFVVWHGLLCAGLFKMLCLLLLFAAALMLPLAEEAPEPMAAAL
jgi:hypothetical protein